MSRPITLLEAQEVLALFLDRTGCYLCSKIIRLMESLYRANVGDAFFNARGKRIWKKVLPEIKRLLSDAIDEELQAILEEQAIKKGMEVNG